MEIGPIALLDLMKEFHRNLRSEGDVTSFDEFEEWSEQAFEEAHKAAQLYLDEYGSEVDGKESMFLNEYDLNEQQMRASLEWGEKKFDNPGGRPSKVDRWADKIESGDATVEEARDHMSDPTWYKLKNRVS